MFAKSYPKCMPAGFKSTAADEKDQEEEQKSFEKFMENVPFKPIEEMKAAPKPVQLPAQRKFVAAPARPAAPVRKVEPKAKLGGAAPVRKPVVVAAAPVRRVVAPAGRLAAPKPVAAKKPAVAGGLPVKTK